METTQQQNDIITINGVEYVKKQPTPTGNRHVIVVDRGWIFAGDLSWRSLAIDGDIVQNFAILTNAVWVFNWEQIGFNGVLDNPKNEKAKIRELNQHIEIPINSIIFKIPVGDTWGL